MFRRTARIPERLLSNLIHIERFDPRLFLAETDHKDNKSFGGGAIAPGPR
jgi:hypothetical protein